MSHATAQLPRFRWLHLCLVVVIAVVTCGAGLWLNHHLAAQQGATVRAGVVWSTLAADVDGIAAAANAIAASSLTAAVPAAEATHHRSDLALHLRALGEPRGPETLSAVVGRLGKAAENLQVATGTLDEVQRVRAVATAHVALARELEGVRAAARAAHDRELMTRARQVTDLRRLSAALFALALIMTTTAALVGWRLIGRFRRQERQTAGFLAALETSELRKAAVIGASLDAIIVMDEAGRITDFNPAAERIFAFRAADVLGQPAIDTIISMPAREGYRRALARFRASGDARHLGRRVETAGLRADGSEFPVELTVTPARIGEQTIFTAHLRDIAERKEQENALRRSNRELEQFAYVASHDLQEPLRMVSGYLALLEKRNRAVLDDKGREFIAHAVDGAERMHALINGLLAYSRVDRGEAPQEPVDASAALAEALEYLRPKLVEAGAEVVSEPLPAVLGDRLQLVQLFQNLVGNAIKYRGELAPLIHIAAVRDGERWRITIRDNGIGIDPMYHERIFEIFQRLHTRAEYPGTGIGLAICKKIVERHGGRLWVESIKGQGATFCFTLAESGSGRFRLRRERSAESSAALRIVPPRQMELRAQG